MTVQRRFEPLLVEMVANEANRAPEDEETVKRADLDVFVCLLAGECTAVPKQIDEAHGDAAINIQD